MLYRLDQKRNGARITIFIRLDIPNRLLTKYVLPDEIFHPSSQSDSYYFNNLDKGLELFSHYDKKPLAGDFDTEVSDNVLNTFLY